MGVSTVQQHGITQSSKGTNITHRGPRPEGIGKDMIGPRETATTNQEGVKSRDE
jgi:hypothetical protein